MKIIIISIIIIIIIIIIIQGTDSTSMCARTRIRGSPQIPTSSLSNHWQDDLSTLTRLHILFA